ncbi:dihydrolipoyl dehydrogenase [Mesorhizobium sp. CAU 1741]|uniref:dihydrolipoyl dehydrogenase n=1 Tax=Mesorhizobium sp. CAU 1741 TaxID=3140366 RepID=UPI00325A4500
MGDMSVDVAIVGAGTAGLAALREVRRRTDNFVIINEEPYGTTCARVGCMPSKALIAAANALHATHRLPEFGITGAADARADIPQILRRVRTLRDHFVEGVLKSTADLGERNIAGRAVLDGQGHVTVGGRRIAAKRIILAPGSSPVVPKPWQALGKRILTSDTLFEQEDLPARMGVIGLGAIGVEIAQALSRLGVEVHAFDAGASVAGVKDKDVAEALQARLRKEFTIHLGAEVELSETDKGIQLSWDRRSTIVDAIVVAIGRKPNVAGLGLETLGVVLDDHGMPPVDANTMRIGDTNVYLAGDGNGDRPLLHEAADEGHIAGINATSDEPVSLERRTPMGVVFCNPEVATIGKALEELDPESTLVGSVSYERQGRARIMQENYGMLRVYADKQDGRILGAAMAAPAAEHLAHLLALAIGQKLTVNDLLRMPFYHPTLEEGFRSALRDIARELPPCGISDLAGCGDFQAEALQ